MNIKETVKQALTMITGKKVFTAQNVLNVIDFNIIGIGLHNDDNTCTIPQVSRALRDIPYVKRSNGRYVVKGRRVPPKPIAAPQLVDNAPALTREALESLRKAA